MKLKGVMEFSLGGFLTFRGYAILSTLKEEGGDSVFYRIDGNHRISAAEDGSDKIKNMITPFSIIFFRTQKEYQKQSKMVFHNTNFKHIPLSMEHNLRLIFEDNENFSDDVLQSDNFGTHFYYAKC
ncbi:hypothetical protein [Helicobacter sp. 23-1045]